MEGKVWRTGANEATTFEVSKAVKVAGKDLAAGKYALFTIVNGDEWTFIFNKTWSQWGAFSYKEADDAVKSAEKAGYKVHPQLVLSVMASPRLPHVLVQAEIETFALEADGTVAWRVAHSDVVTAAELVGGRLVLTSFTGAVSALDPVTGRSEH
jgi:outer membrane protein assembly factor BamB